MLNVFIDQGDDFIATWYRECPTGAEIILKMNQEKEGFPIRLWNLSDWPAFTLFV
jgi:hypothetical protein